MHAVDSVRNFGLFVRNRATDGNSCLSVRSGMLVARKSCRVKVDYQCQWSS